MSTDALARSVPIWEDCRVPGNTYDARQRFRCAALDMMLDGKACARNALTGQRFSTTCTGCPAGKARIDLLDARPRTALVEVAEPAPALVEGDAPQLRAEVAALRLDVARLRDIIIDVQERQAQTAASLGRWRADALARERGTSGGPGRTLRRNEAKIVVFAFRVPLELSRRMYAWADARLLTVIHLIRIAMWTKATAEGHTLETPSPRGWAGGSRSGRSNGPKGVTFSGNVAPGSWTAFIRDMGRRRTLSAFVRDALNAYLEANP